MPHSKKGQTAGHAVRSPTIEILRKLGVFPIKKKPKPKPKPKKKKPKKKKPGSY